MLPSSNISIAVLPFACLSKNPTHELFADGITDEIINSLAKIPQLQVTSRTSSFYFKNKNLPVEKINETLKVKLILEGSVKIYGEQLKVSAQLINTFSDTPFWSESWNRKIENIFDVEEEVSLNIVEKVRENFGHLQITDGHHVGQTQNIGAYEYCLQGRKLFNKWNPEDVNRAIGFFEQAVVLDPQCIDAHTGLADGYSFLAVAGFASREAAWKKSIHHLQIAKTINPNDAPLNYLLANQAFFTEANFKKAMQLNQNALNSIPNYSEANQFMAFLFILRNDFEKANTYLMFAKSIDPLNAETKFYEAYFYYRTKNYKQAENLLKVLISENQFNLPAVITLAYVYLKTQQYAEADKICNSVPTEMIMPDEQLGLKCLQFALAKNTKQLKEPLARLKGQAEKTTSFQAQSYLYKVYCCLKDYKSAFKVLDFVQTKQSSVLLLAFADPLAEGIEQQPEFNQYLNNIFSLPEQEEKTKPQTALITEQLAKEYLKKMDEFIESERPFLNPTLTLKSLAQQINIHPNQLSWLLNEKEGKNFNTFINQLRVNYFKKLATNPANNHISLLGLAYESGFNSKTVFNTVFKKETGLTPKQFLNNQS